MSQNLLPDVFVTRTSQLVRPDGSDLLIERIHEKLMLLGRRLSALSS